MAVVGSTSLVKYDTSELVTGKARRPKATIPKLDRRTPLPATEDLLNAILPPREWSTDGQLWVQKVSSTPATRIDVINLQEQLDLRLQQRQARETGICPIREELYSQCFGTLSVVDGCCRNAVTRGLPINHFDLSAAVHFAGMRFKVFVRHPQLTRSMHDSLTTCAFRLLQMN